MQAVAVEMNLSETAFVMTSQIADFGTRYFTPAAEIPLAGHPTIAVAWALPETGPSFDSQAALVALARLGRPVLNPPSSSYNPAYGRKKDHPRDSVQLPEDAKAQSV